MYIWIKKSLAVLCLLAFCWSSMPAAALELPQEPADQTESGLQLDSAPPLSGEDLPVGNAGTEGGAPESASNGEPQQEEPDAPEKAQPESCTVTLNSQVIEDGQTLSYTTISAAFAGGSVPEGYYPGELTVELAGEIVVEAGGRLDIGTLSIGGAEASPVIAGTGQIVVKKGGRLKLTGAVLAPQGQGPMIIQEAGGSVELVMTPVEDGIVQWSVPLVNNLYDSPDDVWIEVGTVLTGNLLPASMQTAIQEEGHEDYVEIPLSWDLSGYDGRTDGEYVLSGEFLDEAGQPLSSLLPLELTVHWYTPGILVVTEAEWKGSTVPTVELIVQELPEYANVWGEVSTDGGVTWSRWEDEDLFFVVEAEPEGWACIFAVSDEMSGLFRVVAEDPWADEYTCWRSAAFSMCAPEDGEDSGGNRGGSTTPSSPDRQPEPAPRPDRPEEPEDTEPEESEPEDTQPEESEPEDTEPDETTPDPEKPEYPEWLFPFLPLLPSDQEQTPLENEESEQDIKQTSEAINEASQSAYPEHLSQPEPQETALPQETPETWPTQAEQEPVSNAKSDEAENAQAGTETFASQSPEESTSDTTGEQAAVQKSAQPLSQPAQFLLAVAGLAVCVAAVAAVTGLFRKKK